MGLFPRKIDGRYAMIARQDNENLYLIYSTDLFFWDGGTPILKPKFPWGVRPDRNLRRSDRVRRGLASADPRRWPRSQMRDRRGAS
jgi:hypothetical protein